MSKYQFVPEIDGISLREYAVRYDVTNVLAYRMTRKISLLFYDLFGFDPETVSPDEPQREHEILIGNTPYSTVKLFEHEYFIYFLRGNIEINFDRALAFEEAEKCLSEHIFTEEHQTFRDGDYEAGNISDIADGRRNAFLHSGNLRLMSANICGSYGRKAPKDGTAEAYQVERLQYFAETVKQYQPDIIGVQELGPSWRALPGEINHLLPAIGYREVKTTGGNDNYTPIFYRADKYRVLDCFWHVYTMENNSDSKNFTLAVFEERKTGKRIVAFTTHFMYEADSSRKEYYREVKCQNARELSEAIVRYARNYQCAAIGCGDMNSTWDEPCQTILNESGLRNVLDTAETVDQKGTCHNGPKYDVERRLLTTDMNDIRIDDQWKNRVIDHAYVFGNVRAKMHHIPVDEIALLTTDHTLVVVDYEY